MLDAGVAMEVSTAGLRKPVGEIYPARRVARDGGRRRASRSRCPRDAHTPEHLAFGYEEAVELLRDCGVKEIAVFERRARRMEPLG